MENEMLKDALKIIMEELSEVLVLQSLMITTSESVFLANPEFKELYDAALNRSIETTKQMEDFNKKYS